MKRILIPLVILLVLAGGAWVLLRLLAETPTAIRKRADESFQAGDYDEALLNYRKLLGKDQADGEALRRAGEIWMKRGAPLRALPFLREARDSNTANPEVRRMWAELVLAMGDVRAAREEALAILDQDAANGEALVMLANTSFGAEQIAEARSRLASLDPEKDATYHLADAILLGREGQADAVETALQRALAIDEDSAVVHLAFASYYASRNDSARQVASLARAAECAETRSNAHVRYALALAGEKQFEEARAVLDGILRKANDYLPARQALADLQAREGDFEKALGTLESVLRVDPVNLEARSTEARVHVAMGEPAKAVESYEKLIAAYPQAPGLRYEVATYYLRNNEPAKARSSLEKAVEIAPEQSADHAKAAMLLAELDLRENEPAAAATRLESLSANHPGNQRLPFLLARAYRDAGRADDAEALYLDAIEDNPKNPALPFALAQFYKSESRFEDAMQRFEQAQSLAPDDQTITIELIALDIRNKDFARAHARLQPFFDKPEPDWGAWYLKGRVLTAEERWEDAEQALQTALELKPGSLSVYNLLVENYLKNDQTAAAIARLQALAAENPKSLQHRMLLSLLLERQGDYQRAAENYRALLNDHPQFVPALNNLAYISGNKLGELADAEDLARAARRHAPEDAAVADTLGWILAQQADEAKINEGLSLLTEASGRNDDPEIRYHLAVALAKTGSREEAQRVLARAIQSDTEAAWKDDAAQFLASLGGAPVVGGTIAELEAQRNEKPLDVPLRLRLAQLYEEQGDSDKAVAVYREVLKLDERQPQALMALARLLENENPSEARALARQAWQAVPSDADARALEARWLLAEKAHRQAYQLLSQIAPATKSSAHLRDFAMAAYSIGKTDEARAAMERVPTDSPSAGEAATFLALTADPGADGLAALEAQAEKVLEADPANTPALMLRARRLVREGQAQPAIEIYEQIRERRPSFSPALLALANLYAETPATLDQAETLALKVLEQDGSSLELDRLLGEVLARKGRFDSALAPLEKCDQAGQLDPEGLFFLGKAYFNANRPEDGKTTLQRAQQAGLPDDLAKETTELLSEDTNN